jgi:hypothetical protein
MKFSYFFIILFLGAFVSNASAQVTVFSLPNFMGTSRVLNTGANTLTFNVRSVRVQGNFFVELRSGSSCTNVCRYWKNGTSSSVFLAMNGCTAFVQPMTQTNPKFKVTIQTGSDDLRAGSRAFVELNIQGVGIRTFELNVAGGLPNWSTKTFLIDLPNINANQIIDHNLIFASVRNNIFDSADNWNVNQITYEYLPTNLSSGLLMWNASGNPLVRFTEQLNRFNAGTSNHWCL